MDSPPVTVQELIAENRRLREVHARHVGELARTLRDQFAMAALHAVLRFHVVPATSEEVARMAYELADAMLMERGRQS